MKKIILFSCLFSLITSSAFATYYKTNTYNCGDANMLAELDRATALHRAVITEVECDIPVAKPKPVVKNVKSIARPYIPKKFVKPVYQPRPTYNYVSNIVISYDCNNDCCDCVDTFEPSNPIVVPIVISTETQGDAWEIEQCEKYGKCAS